MQKYELEFCFKGSRDYVQGPDIFDAVLEKLKNNFNLSELKKVKYAAHNMLYSNANLYVVENLNKEQYKTINSIITFNFKNKKNYAIVSKNDKKISCRKEYSEEIVRTFSKINGKFIIFENVLDYTLTEIIVSMNKYYLQETVTKNGKWIVTQFEYINLDKYFDIKGKILKLELLSNFNNKLTKSKIFIEDQLIGYLYFSLVKR